MIISSKQRERGSNNLNSLTSNNSFSSSNNSSYSNLNNLNNNNSSNNNNITTTTQYYTSPITINNNEIKNPTERYCLREKIGQGGYGYVYKAIDTITGEIVAAKLINLDEAGDELESVQQEIAVMSASTCCQLTKYYASYLSGR